MKRLLFSNPVFDDVEINITIRYGAKWLGSDGTHAEVYDPNEKTLYGYANIAVTGHKSMSSVKHYAHATIEYRRALMDGRVVPIRKREEG